MKNTTYEVETGVEATHWWFANRRKLLADTLAALGIKSSATILDAGTGTGSNLRMLRDLGFSNFSGIDLSHEAIKYCAEKNLGTVQHGDVCDLPFLKESFDVVLATDIIEHVEEDAKAILEIFRVLKPGGVCIFIVPTFQSLWGYQDEISHHKRRYRLKPFVRLIEGQAFRVESAFYFNYILMPPIWFGRQLIKVFKPQIKSENEINTPLLNKILERIFAFDILTAKVVKPPFGVSALVIARKSY